jgi:hypothetical protein
MSKEMYYITTVQTARLRLGPDLKKKVNEPTKFSEI